MRRISITEAIHRTGTTFRKLDYWCRVGLFPIDNPQPGSGHSRRFYEHDIPAIRVLDRLMSVRDLTDRFGQITRHVQEHGPHGTIELIPGITIDLERLHNGVQDRIRGVA